MASLNVVISLESFSSKATSKNIGELVLHLAHIVSRKFIVTVPLSLQPALFLLLAHWHPGEDQDTLLPECLAKHLLKDLYHCHQRSIQPRRLAVHGTAKEVAVVLQGGDQLGDDLDVCVAVWIIKAIFFAFS